VGLAWKAVQALLLAERKSPVGHLHEPFSLGDLLDLVALGTVADVADLVGENRTLVWAGLERLRVTERPGLVALMQSAHVAPGEVDAEAIGFWLGPRINAAGRLEHAMTAYQLLRATTMERAEELAERLEFLNRRRQELTRQALARAEAQITDPCAPLLLVSDEQCPEGIVGLVAGRLVEEYYRPAVVVSQGPEWSKASCRSIPGFDITEALDELAPLLERHGGHAAAAGFTVRTENLPALEKGLIRVAAEKLSQLDSLCPPLVGDAELPLHDIDHTLFNALQWLAPFGAKNEAPLWMCRNVRVRDARQVGSDQKHLKLTLLDERRRTWRAIAFRHGTRYDALPPVLDIAFSIKRNEWNGSSRLELHLADFRPAAE
ncbi:MAG: single-stranded-DNA-specific exonuclease RecJ, partial [Ardenticatenaceae bacterium]